MSDKLAKKLKDLPKEPGVYFHKNAKGEIIYVGKAAILRNRVRQYFQKSRSYDPKTELLISKIADIDWQVVDNETEALFLEAELIRRYMPRFNILLRDDKSMTYLRINFKESYPSVTFTRRPLDDGADYYGPFLSALALKKALKYLRRAFPYSTHTVMPNRACLQYHLGLCPGPETGKLDKKSYKSNLKRLVKVIKGQQKKLLKELNKEMQKHAAQSHFEKAATVRNQIFTLKNLEQQIIFGDKEFLDISKDHALIELSSLLGLKKPPKRIEGYDISHMSGTDTVASMVVFMNGVPSKKDYRKFKSTIAGNNDFAHIHEVIMRRFCDNNIKKWGLPDLMLIDGGKGQLGAAINALEEKNIFIPIIGLAKRYEEIIIANHWNKIKINFEFVDDMQGLIKANDSFTTLLLPTNTNIIKLLQRIRDESHRFAVGYHTVLKTKRQTNSLLDEVPSIGSVTKKKLLREVGSLAKIKQSTLADLSNLIGSKKAIILWQYIHSKKDTIEKS